MARKRQNVLSQYFSDSMNADEAIETWLALANQLNVLRVVRARVAPRILHVPAPDATWAAASSSSLSRAAARRPVKLEPNIESDDEFVHHVKDLLRQSSIPPSSVRTDEYLLEEIWPEGSEFEP